MFWRFLPSYLYNTLEKYSFECRCKKCGLLVKSLILTKTTSTLEANEEYSMFCYSLRLNAVGNHNLFINS